MVSNDFSLWRTQNGFKLELPKGSPPLPVYTQKNEISVKTHIKPEAYAGQTELSPYEFSVFDGSKFALGFGPTQMQMLDYWTLRARSSQLFNENLYARGIIKRLITNEINTGLTPEAAPDEEILKRDLADWTETTETRFNLWSKDPNLCDYYQEKTFGAIQRDARMEALITGDVLVILHISRKTGLPQVQLVSGNRVDTPLTEFYKLPKGHEIIHGVEFDAKRRKIAYWVKQDDFEYKRVPAYGSRSKRKIAWLVYGTSKRLDETRGQPLLSVVLQSLKEIDRYRDSTQRKALINSFVAMFIKKTQDKIGTLPITGGATRKESRTSVDSSGNTRTYNITKHHPGMILEELQQGEEPVSFGSHGTDLSFESFEKTIINAIGWANEIPPEILTLAFSNNYSASQAAINEFKIYLNKIWTEFGEEFCSPIYTEWMLSETLSRRLSAPGFLESWRDPSRYDEFAAWLSVDWYGSIKPSTDTFKQAKGSKLLVAEGWSTNARESRITTGTKFSKNLKRLRRENELKVEAMRPLLELGKTYDIVNLLEKTEPYMLEESQ